jgi:hypothetical protein
MSWVTASVNATQHDHLSVYNSVDDRMRKTVNAGASKLTGHNLVLEPIFLYAQQSDIQFILERLSEGASFVGILTSNLKHLNPGKPGDPELPTHLKRDRSSTLNSSNETELSGLA